MMGKRQEKKKEENSDEEREGGRKMSIYHNTSYCCIFIYVNMGRCNNQEYKSGIKGHQLYNTIYM